MTRDIVVTGITGRLGRSVAGALRTAGYRVIALVRQHDGDDLADELIPICGFDHLPRLVSRPAAVVHLAAETRDPARMCEVNVRGCEALLEWSIEQRANQFVYMSSVGVYGPRWRGIVTPRTERRPVSEYEVTKARAEALVLVAGDTGRIPVTVLQPSNVFGTGPRWGEPLLGFIRSVTDGRFRYIGRRPARFNYVDVRDVASACVGVLRPEARGRTFILNDPLPLDEAVSVIAWTAGVPSPNRRISEAAARCAALAFEALALLTKRRAALTLGQVKELTNRATYDGAEIQAALGFIYPVGTARGLADLVTAYRQRALIS